MPLLKVPEHVIDELNRFISETYSDNSPNSLLTAQAFNLKYPDHGTKYGLPGINKAIEEWMKQGRI